MSDFETRVTKFTVVPKGGPLFHERATDIFLEDESGGEFVVVQQHGEGYGKIAIDFEEWPALRAAIEDMMAYCRKEAQP